MGIRNKTSLRIIVTDPDRDSGYLWRHTPEHTSSNEFVGLVKSLRSGGPIVTRVKGTPPRELVRPETARKMATDFEVILRNPNEPKAAFWRNITNAWKAALMQLRIMTYTGRRGFNYANQPSRTVVAKGDAGDWLVERGDDITHYPNTRRVNYSATLYVVSKTKNPEQYAELEELEQKAIDAKRA